MALIGTWGKITFAVSRKKIKTFDDLKWDFSAKYATHDRHLKKPLLEFTGTDIENISFTMFFSVFLGVNPMTEILKLRKAVERGEVNRLIIGSKAYGSGKWVITKISNTMERYDNHGNLLAAKANITMQSYENR